METSKLNPFKIGDLIKLKTSHHKPLLPELVVDYVYVVEDIVSDRVVIEDRMYFASRFILAQ